MSGLEQKLCPVKKDIFKVPNIKVAELVLYGLKSNDCNDCGGFDTFCEIYRDFIRGKNDMPKM